MFHVRYFFMVVFSAILQSMVLLSNNIGGVGVATPNRMNNNTTVKKGWDLRLQKKSHIKSIFTDLEGEYSTETKKLPNAIVVNIPGTAKNDWSYTYQIVMPLTGTGTFTGTLIGEEEQIVTKMGTAYREESRHAVTTKQYGAEFLEADAYKLYGMTDDLLGDWNKEQYDLMCHQAVHETYGETLLHNSTSAVCLPNFNRNVLVLGYNTVAEASVTYSSNSATYANNIVAKMAGANSGSLAPTASQILDSTQLEILLQFLIRRKVMQLSIPGLPGGKGWIALVSEIMAGYMRNKVWSQNNLGSLWIDSRGLSDQAMKFDMVIGSYGKFLFIEDNRFSTALPAGSSAPYSLTTGYMTQGDTDGRNLDEEYVREAILVLGMGAIWKWEPEPIHFINQLDDYGKIKGVGTARVIGLGSMNYNEQTPSVLTCDQYSSAVVYAAHPRTAA